MHTAMETERCDTVFYTPRNLYDAIQTTQDDLGDVTGYIATTQHDEEYNEDYV